ncbi:MAG: hypothetical protein HC925_08955 [Coleofasciculaceae cyanobacterium SM2_3_26]|nr:hypothetical protein [Coleofasciculaceae cyanobacterium SM2_3_26]
MKNALTVSPSHRASQETYKAIVLTVGDRLLALPVNFILKIINAPPELSDDLNAMGLIYLKDRVLTVLDLYAQLGVSAGGVGDRKISNSSCK